MQKTPVLPTPTLDIVLTGGLAAFAGLIVNAAPDSRGPDTDPDRFFTTSRPQLLTFTGTGAMKSLRAEVNESDERLLRYAEPNESHPLPKIAARLIDASPNVRAE